MIPSPRSLNNSHRVNPSHDSGTDEGIGQAIMFNFASLLESDGQIIEAIEQYRRFIDAGEKYPEQVQVARTRIALLQADRKPHLQ